MCRGLILLFLMVAVVVLCGSAQAATILHWEFDGSLGSELTEDTDIWGGMTATKFSDSDLAADANNDITYGMPNFWYNQSGTSADFNNTPGDNDPGVGLFVPDGGVDSLVDLSTLTECTIEAFIYPYELRQQVVIRKYSGGDYTGVYYIDTRENGEFGVRLGGPNGDLGDSGAVCHDLTYVPDEWYHVALVWNGSTVKCYVNLEQSQDLGPEALSEVEWTGPIGDSDRAVGIGCIVRGPMTSAGSPPRTGQFAHARIDEIRISDVALGPEDFTGAEAKKYASQPDPGKGAVFVCPDSVVLRWKPGISVAATDGHDVYLGTSYNDVLNATTSTPGIYKGRQDSNEYPEVGSLTLEMGETYYWRIDELDPPYKWEGMPWGFTTDDGKARDRMPGDGFKGVDPNGVLSWTASCLALSHDVYLGTNLEDVNNATDPNVWPGRGNQTGTTYNPGGLAQQTSYYWRVDEVTSRGTFKGDVFSFKTGYGGVLVHFDFDGTKGNNLPDSLTDLTGRVTFEKYIDDDPEDAGTVKYGDPNPFDYPKGTSAEFVPNAGLYRIDPCTAEDILRLDGSGYTIEMWVKPDTLPMSDIALVKKYSAWAVGLGNRRVEFRHRDNPVDGERELWVGEWTHIAAVFDQMRSSDQKRIYVDGVLDDDEGADEANPADNNDPVSIGYMLRPASKDYSKDDFFYGSIDELVISDVALGPGEFVVFPGPDWASNPTPYDKQGRIDPCDPNLALIWVPGASASSQELYLGTDYEAVRDAEPGWDPCGVHKGPLSADANSYHLGATLDFSTIYYWRVAAVGAETWKGLVWRFRTRSEIVDPNLWVWYEFDEESGGDVHDSSGRDYDSYDGSADGQWDPNGGQWGGALWCDDDMGLGVSDEVLSNINNGITVSVWLKEAYRPGGDNWVFDGGNDSTYRVRAAVVDDDGLVLWRAGNDSNDTLTWDLAEIAGVRADKLEGWHHWAFVKDESAGTISIYYDGDLADSNDRTAPTLVNVQDGDFKIAALTRRGSDLIGWIDDFRLYDYAKSAKQIEEIYRGGDLALAWKPDPFDGEGDVSRDLEELSWNPGDYATSHDVYFGTDLEAVTDANTTVTFDVYRGNQPLADTNFAVPMQLELNRTYYWRVDEINSIDPNMWTGRVWSLRVANYLIVDDFESYGLTSDPINSMWLDGIRFVPYPPYFETVNGALVSLGARYATPSDPVNTGQQSMIIDYDNSGQDKDVPYFSEVEREYGAAQDWTEAEVKILSLFFYGDPNNDANSTEQMYVGVGDSDSNAVVNYGHYVDEDMNDIKEEEWHQWSVALSDFAGINAQDIRKLFVGFGNREEHPVAGGSGNVYFDDIRLYRQTCIPTRLKPAGDFDDDCTADFTDVMLMADDWLRTDVNFADLGITVVEPSTDGLVGWWKLDDGDGNTATDWSSYAVQGTVEGKYSWVTGFDGVNGAVEFSGDGGRVLVPDGAHLRPADKVTATAWVYYSRSPSHSARVVCKGADNKETFGMEINSNDRFLFRVRSDGNTSELPGYDVNSASGYLWHDEWIHLAGTFDGAADTVKCYVNGQVVDRRDDVNFVSALGKTLSQDTSDLAIGNRSDSTNREFIGVIDDVRVYSRALSEAEIGWLASDGSGYVPLRSRYNIYDLEPADKPQSINLRDLTVLANDWLKTKLWPPEP